MSGIEEKTGATTVVISPCLYWCMWMCVWVVVLGIVKLGAIYLRRVIEDLCIYIEVILRSHLGIYSQENRIGVTAAGSRQNVSVPFR